MFSSIFFLGAFFLSIPMGWLVDSVGVYWTMAVGQLIVGSFILCISLVNSFHTICGLLFLAGMGHGTINPSTGKAVMSWFSIRGRATAMGINNTGIPMEVYSLQQHRPLWPLLSIGEKQSLFRGPFLSCPFFSVYFFIENLIWRRNRISTQHFIFSRCWRSLKTRI